MGLYPFDPISKGRDVSPNKAPNAKFINVALTQGPDGRANSAVKFFGLPNSYVQIPNNGKLRANRALSMFAWIKPQGNAGPIINYNVGPSWETHLWLKNPRTLLARFVKIGGVFTPAVTKTALRQNAWSFVGATYDGNFARLWVNGKNLATRKIPRIRLSTFGPIRIGAKIGDPRYFKGAVACVQLYRVALNKKQIKRAMKGCMRRKFTGQLRGCPHLVPRNHRWRIQGMRPGERPPPPFSQDVDDRPNPRPPSRRRRIIRFHKCNRKKLRGSAPTKIFHDLIQETIIIHSCLITYVILVIWSISFDSVIIPRIIFLIIIFLG